MLEAEQHGLYGVGHVDVRLALLSITEHGQLLWLGYDIDDPSLDFEIVDPPPERRMDDGRLEMITIESSDPQYMGPAMDGLAAHVNRVRGMGSIAAMQQGMQGCTVVFHCAALVSEWGPRADYERANVQGTQRIIDAARTAGVPVLVHVSTEAVLADGTPILDADESRPLPEHPLPRYPATKAAAEKLVRAANGPGLRTVVVRPRLIWGNDDSSVLTQLEHAVNAGRFMWIGDGRYPTSSCHVDNLCEGLILAAEKGRGGEVYFVTDGAPVELREFVSAMLRTRGVEVELRFGAEGLRAWRLAHGDDARLLVMRGRLRQQMADEDGARDDFSRALALADATPNSSRPDEKMLSRKYFIAASCARAFTHSNACC